MNTPIAGTHQGTYDAIFQHPVSRNLKWIDMRAMLVSVAETVQENGDVLKIVRNGKTLTLHRPTRNGMGSVDDLMKVRHFLEHSMPADQQTKADGVHLLIVIDHRLARIYETDLKDTVPQRITPYDPSGFGRHLHNVEDDANGQRKPEQKSFYEAIAKATEHAHQILIFGSGTGASSAMEHLVSELKANHSELSKKVIGSVAVNEQHLTENQLLAKAREFYAANK